MRLRTCIGLLAAISAFVVFATLSHRVAYAQEKAAEQDNVIPQVWFYRDVPLSKSAKDERTDSERYFSFFYYLPGEKADDISVNDSKPATDLSPDETGTCIEVLIRLKGVGDWGGAGFIPGGKIGEKPARNIIDKDHFVVGFGRPVALRWRARTSKDSTVKARFSAFGFSSGTLVDGINPSLTPDPATSVLTDKWTDFSIDVTENADGLNSVVCPLKVVVKADDNPNVKLATVYIDDVRLEISKATNTGQ